MGTNYYLRIYYENTTEYENIHIGRNAAGWQFLFQGYLNIRSTKDWKQLFHYGIIFDEYDNMIPTNKFWNIVRQSFAGKCLDEDNYYFDEDGYWFSTSIFS